LVKYLLNECSTFERKQVEDWKNAKPENLREYEKIKEIWEQSRTISALTEVDTDGAWEKFKHIRHQKGRVGQPALLVGISWLRNNSMVIAASVVLVFGIGLLFKFILKPNQSLPKTLATILLETGPGTRLDTLPDGTIVTLNKNSWLSYPEEFQDSIRKVLMEGEIFFEVAEDRTKPFVVNTGTTEIRVLGTSFNVRNRQGNTAVIVETGVVRVSSPQKQAVVPAGKNAIVQDEDSLIRIGDNHSALHQYFRSGQFICDNTPLIELVSALSDAFGVEVKVGDNNIGNMRITTTFRSNSLEEILSVIEETMNVKAIRKDNSIIIR
jgi:ferric-dicitrate binding protein FerR (iron transport regulator)